jgi:hypothetical protein
MQFRYSYPSDADHIEGDILRIVDWVREHRAEAVWNLVVECHASRNGKRLQAINDRGEIRPVCFDLTPEDPRFEQSDAAPREKITIRERTEDPSETGLATAFNRDD